MGKTKLDNLYTQKTLLPIFEPNEENVEIEDMVDVDKYVRLIKEINLKLSENKLSDKEAQFLKLAATRWIKFNFKNVAQFYATKATPEFQRMLERSAMVLIDIDKAFENELVYSNNFIKNICYNEIDDSLKIENYMKNQEKVLENEC